MHPLSLLLSRAAIRDLPAISPLDVSLRQPPRSVDGHADNASSPWPSLHLLRMEDVQKDTVKVALLEVVQQQEAYLTELPFAANLCLNGRDLRSPSSSS